MDRTSILYCAHKGYPKPVRTEQKIMEEARDIIRRCSSIDYRRSIRNSLKNLKEKVS